MIVTELKCNHRPENINVDSPAPVFDWRLQGPEQNVRQTSYRLQVWQEDGLLVWDSGCVNSSSMTNIPYEGEKLLSNTRYLWKAECNVAHENGNMCLEESSFFETGFYDREDWKGIFIGEIADGEYHLYRKGFSAGKVKKAKLYICGLGHFQCYLNGSAVSDHVLEPGWSNYDKTCFYTAYDVTAGMQEGENALLVKLGDGMFNVPGGRYVYYERSYGKARLLVQLELWYEDGSRQQLVTDDSWRMITSPIRFCCIYGGEDYDASLWKEEYLLAGYQPDHTWQAVHAVESPKGALKAMPMEPMKVMARYGPLSIREVRPGVWLYDLGKNFSGWARMKIKTDGSMAGRKIVLTPGELLNQEGDGVDQRVTGRGYAWSYILDDRQEQEFAPDFTYTGFRYVEMTGAVPVEYQDKASEKLPVITQLRGEFLYPDVAKGGEFTCSNTLFNSIHDIVLQAILSNTKSYFTDCPHREKLGWLEETHLIGPSIMYNLEVHNLYDKVEGDMADAQRENGLVPDICPEYVTGFEKWHQGFADSPEWGSACIINPWYVYKRYGDVSLLGRYYDVMKQYLDYLGSRTHHMVLHHGLGDWLDIGPCTPHSQNTPVPVVATCIYYYDLDIMEQTARLLGKEQDASAYRRLREQVYEEYNLQFLDDQTGRYATGSQAAQAMSLMVGLVPAGMEEKVVKQLRDDVVKRGYAITAGDIGHPFLIRALMKYGMGDILDRMTNITETPGYGYQVVNGATTLTEEWDGPEPSRPHGSQNHLMLGSIEEWFYGGLGGMELIRDNLAFDEIRIAPCPVKSVDWVKARTMHPYGEIEVQWRKQDGNVQVEVEIPHNITAFLEDDKGQLQCKVGSGHHSYSFSL